MPVAPLQSRQLAADIGLQDLPFLSLEELQPSDDFIGQERAKKALEVGLALRGKGYNLFVMGDLGSGRVSLTMRCLKIAARLGQASSDWVYVNNFDDASEPRAIQLPAGIGSQFIKDCQKMVNRFLVIIPAAFESPYYQRKKTAIDMSFKLKVESAIERIEQEAYQKSIALYQEGSSISFSPILDGEAVDDIKFASLSQEKRNEINETIDQLEAKLSESLLELPLWKRESNDLLHTLKNSTINNAIESFIDEIEKKYRGISGIQFYLKDIRRHLVDIILDHFELVEQSDAKDSRYLKELLQHTFVANLLVSNLPSMGSPVIFEANPTFANLFGRIEYVNDGGVATTSFQHIRSGALHRANGGYLLLEVEKLFSDNYLWGQLKRALVTQLLKFEPPLADSTTSVNQAIEPHGIPLNIKIVLVGSREHYYFLQQNDSEFNELFGILVDFDEHIERTQSTLRQFAQLVQNVIKNERYAPITCDGFIELVRYSCRLGYHQKKFSARFGEVFTLLGEADLIRAHRHDSQIGGQHLLQAQNQRESRHSRIRNEMLESIIDGQIVINTSGESIGGINGLTIWAVGSTEFGMPARITATVTPGKKGIVDIEKESHLGLSIHSKGVLILSGFLANRYALDFPLTLSANIVLEQSYGFVDGDSASLGELCALISAIVARPIHQSFAITGSINQFGEVQAVGGINEKIEGFFLLCKSRGLSGEQAVIFPKANLSHLMLDSSVIRAVEQELFKLYAVENVEQTLELIGLTANGTLAELNSFISAQLKRLYQISRLHDIGTRH